MVRRPLLAALAFGLLGGWAIHTAAQQLPPRPPILVDMQWGERPVIPFPEAAESAGVRYGQAIISCQVTAEGHPHDCRVEAVEPAGYGFGTSAIAALTEEAVVPRTSDDTPAPGAFRTHAIFDAASASGLFGDLEEQGGRNRLGQWARSPAPVPPRGLSPADVSTDWVILACRVAEAGRLTDCLVQQESRLQIGLGAAALTAASDARISIRPPAAGQRIQFPVIFNDDYLAARVTADLLDILSE